MQRYRVHNVLQNRNEPAAFNKSTEHKKWSHETKQAERKQSRITGRGLEWTRGQEGREREQESQDIFDMWITRWGGAVKEMSEKCRERKGLQCLEWKVIWQSSLSLQKHLWHSVQEGGESLNHPRKLALNYQTNTDSNTLNKCRSFKEVIERYDVDMIL